MPSRVLVIVEGGPSGIDRRDTAAVSMARRFSAETGAELEALVSGSAVVLPGTWSRCWLLTAVDARAIVAEAAAIAASGDYTSVFTGETPLGREVAGRLAARLGCPVVAGVQATRMLSGALQLTRPAVAGTRSVMLAALKLPAIVVVSADISAAEAAPSVMPESQELIPAHLLDGPELLAETRLSPWEMDVAEAEVVVAGGRGVGGVEGFELLGTLAERLGGAVGATRVAVDLGWVSRDRQVGLTGRTVSPRFYLACGVSGAIHHTLGMRSSGFIAAINTDPRCPIFSIANASVVGDVREVVPALIAEIDRRRALAAASREPIGAAR